MPYALTSGASLRIVGGIRITRGLRRLGLLRAPEDGQHPLDRHDEEFVVMLELDGDGLARIEEHLVVLPDGLVLVVFDGLADGDDPAGNDGNFVAIGEDDAGFGLALVVILADDDALADGLDDVVFGAALGGFGGHVFIVSANWSVVRCPWSVAGVLRGWEGGFAIGNLRFANRSGSLGSFRQKMIAMVGDKWRLGGAG